MKSKSLLSRAINMLDIKSRILKELVLLIVLAAAVVVLLFFFLRSTEYVTITMRVSSSDSLVNHWFNRAPQWYLETLQPGKATTDMFGQTSVEVVDTYYYPNYGDFETLYVTARVRALYSSSNNEYGYNGDPLLVGQFIELSIDGILVPGVIQSIENDASERKSEQADLIVYGELEAINNSKIVNSIIEYEGIKNFMLSSISESASIKDSNGNTYFEIISVEKKPSYKSFPGNNSLVKVLDTERERVFLTAKVKANIVNENLFYIGEYPLRKNVVIPVYLDNATVYLTVFDINPS